MDSGPEKTGNSDEVDGGLVGKSTAGTSQVPTDTDRDASTTTSCVIEASQGTPVVNNNEETINEDVVFSNSRCEERSGGSQELGSNVVGDTVSPVEELSDGSLEDEAAKETSNSSELEESSDKVNECMEVSELSPAKSSTAEGPQVGQVSTTTESPFNLPVTSEKEDSTEHHGAVSPSSDTVLRDCSVNSEDLTIPTTTTDPNETASPQEINDQTALGAVILNSAHHEVSCCESTLPPHLSNDALPSTQSHSLDELPSSSTSEDYTTKHSESTHDDVHLAEQTTRNDMNISTTNKQYANESTTAIEEDSFVGSDISGASMEVHASKSLIVSSVSDVPSDDAMPSPSALSKDGESSSIAGDMDGEQADLIIAHQDDTVTNMADSMLNEALPKTSRTSSPNNIAASVDSTTGLINHQTELTDVCKSRVQNKADSPGLEEEVTESVSAFKSQQHFGNEEDLVESSSEEACAIKSPENEMLPEDQQMPTSIQLREDISVPEQSSNNVATEHSCEPADGGIPMESENTSEVKYKEVQNKSAASTCKQTSQVETTVQQPESMDVKFPGQTDEPEPMEDSVTLSHHCDDVSSNEQVSTGRQPSANKTVSQIPDTTASIQESTINESSSDIVTSPTDVSDPVLTTESCDTDDISSGEAQEPPKLGLVDYPNDSEEDDNANNNVSEIVQDSLPAPPSPALSTASTPSSASLSSLDELPDETVVSDRGHVPEEDLPDQGTDQIDKEPLVESHQRKSASPEPLVAPPEVRSCEPLVKSPDPQIRSPKPLVTSPEPSPEPQVRSPEPLIRPPDPQVRSPEPQVRSPEPQVRSPEPKSEQVSPCETEMESTDTQTETCELETHVKSPEPKINSTGELSEQPSEVEIKKDSDIKDSDDTIEGSFSFTSISAVQGPVVSDDAQYNITTIMPDSSTVAGLDEDDDQLTDSDDELSSVEGIEPFEQMERDSLAVEPTTTTGEASMDTSEAESISEATATNFNDVAVPEQPECEASEQMDTSESPPALNEEKLAVESEVSQSGAIRKSPDRVSDDGVSSQVVGSVETSDNPMSGDLPESTQPESSPKTGPYDQQEVGCQDIEFQYQKNESYNQEISDELDNQKVEAESHDQETRLETRETELCSQEAEFHSHEAKCYDQETALKVESFSQEGRSFNQDVESLGQDMESHSQEGDKETISPIQEAESCDQGDNLHQFLIAESHNQEAQCLSQDVQSFDPETRLDDHETEAQTKEAESLNQDALSYDQEAGSHHQETGLHDQEAGSHHQEAESHDQEAESHNQEAELHDREAESHNQEAKSHDQEAELHYQEAELHDQEAGFHDQDAGSHDQEAGSYHQETGSHGQEAESHNQEAELHYQEAELHDQDAGSHDQESWSHDQEAVLHDQEAESHDQGAGFHDQDAGSYDQEAGSYDQEAESHYQEAESHYQEAESHDQEAEPHDQEAQSYDQEAKLHDQEAELHDQEAELHDQEAELHDQEAELHDQEAESHDQEAESHDQEAELDDQEAESHNQEAESHDQEAGSHGQESGLHNQEVKSHIQKSESLDSVAESYDKGGEFHDIEAEHLHHDAEPDDQEARMDVKILDSEGKSHEQEAGSHGLKAESCDQKTDLYDQEFGSDHQETESQDQQGDFTGMETEQEVEELQKNTSKMNLSEDDSHEADNELSSKGVLEADGMAVNSELEACDKEVNQNSGMNASTIDGIQPQDFGKSSPVFVADHLSAVAQAASFEPVEPSTTSDNLPPLEMEDKMITNEAAPLEDDMAVEGRDRESKESSPTEEKELLNQVSMDDNEAMEDEGLQEVICDRVSNEIASTSEHAQAAVDNGGSRSSSSQDEVSFGEVPESTDSLEHKESLCLEHAETNLQPSLKSLDLNMESVESSSKSGESGMVPAKSGLEQMELKEPVDSSLSDVEIQQNSQGNEESVDPDDIPSNAILNIHPSSFNSPHEEIIQDDNISSNTVEAMKDCINSPVTTENTEKSSQVHSSNGEEGTVVGQGDPDTASSATAELDVERVTEETGGIQPATNVSTATGGESEDSDESSDSSSSDSDSDDNQSSSSSSSQDDQIETTVIAEMNTSIVSTGEVNSDLLAEPEMDTSTVKEDGGEVTEDVVPEEDVVISKVENEHKQQQAQEDFQEVSKIVQESDEVTILEKSQPGQPTVTEDQVHKPEESPVKSHVTRMPPRPIPDDSMETWRSLGNDSKTNKADGQGSTSVIASTSEAQQETIGRLLQQYKSQIAQSSQEATQKATENDLQKVTETMRIQTFQGLSDKAQYLSKYNLSYGIPSMSGSAPTATTMANYRPVIATSVTTDKLPTEASGSEQSENRLAGAAVEKIAGRLVQLTPGGDARTLSSSAMETSSSSGSSSTVVADNLGSPLHKGLTKDKFSLERVGGDSHGNVYWYDGGKNLYQTTTDFIVTPENMASLAPICNSMNKWLAKLKSLRSSGSDDDLELVKHIKEHYIHRVHQAVQRRRSKASGDATLKQSQHQMSYTSSTAMQNFAGNIQKQLAAAVAATEITTAATTAVSTSAVATVVTQAPTKAVKQRSSASSSRSGSPQVVQQQQQYIIQHQPQQALYTMGLSQLGAIIPGLMSQVDQSKTSNQSSQSSTPVTTNTTATISEQAKSDSSVSKQSASKEEERAKKSTPSSVTAHSVIQATPVVSVERSRHSSVTSVSTSITSMVSSSVATATSSSSSTAGGVIINPYQYYAIAGGSVASIASSSTPSSGKEKVIASTATASSKLATTSSVSTSVQSSVSTPTVMPAQQMQYAVVNTGGQQQLYAMPSGAQIQTGYLFFQQPNGMMVAIPAQTVVQPGGSTQVAIAPQQLAALSGGAIAVQQQQKTATTTSAESTEDKTKESDTITSTSTTQKSQQRQQQVYVPMPAIPQYELSKPPTDRGSKGKRSSSSSVSDESQKGSKDQQHHHMKHHSTTPTPTSATGFKYSSLYIPRGAHAYRVAAAQASAAAAMSTQQSSSSTTSATATTVTSSTTLEKTKETEEAGASSLVPIQLVQQSQYAREDHGVIHQNKQVTTASATTISSTVSSSSSTSQSKMTVPAMYGGLAVAGRAGTMLNTTGGTTTAPHMQQMMVRAVAQGPSGVYEVKASSLADIDPVSVKQLTEKYEQKIVKMYLQTALMTKNQSDVPAESSDKSDKPHSSHKDSASQLPIDETAAAKPEVVEHKDETTKPAAKKRSRAKKPLQAEGTEPNVDKAEPLANDASSKPSTAATRKRKNGKEEDGEQEVTQAAKRKRGPNKKKLAVGDEALGTEEESNKPTKTPASQRGKKGKAANEAAKGALKSAVVSISLEALADVPSPIELDEEQNKSGRKRKLPNEDHLQGAMSRKAKAALLAAHKTSKDPKMAVDIDELSTINPESLDFTVLNEITGDEFQEERSPDTSSRQKRKCVAVREKVTKLHQMLEKAQMANQKAANATSGRRKRAPQATASTAVDDDDITAILPVSKPAPKKNRFPFSSSRSRRHRRKREEPLWQSASQKGGRFTRNAKCKAVYVFSTHLANEASKAVMNKSHKSIIRYHEQFASKAGYLHKLPQHKRLMNFGSPNSPSKDVKSTAKASKAGVTGSKTRSRQQTRNRDDVDFHEDNIHEEEEEEQSSSSDNSDSDSDSNSSSSQATNKNLRHFSASSEQDSHDQSRNRIDSHTSPPTSPELNMIPPPHNRTRWESSSKSLFSRTEELLRAAEMAQQGELRSFDMQGKPNKDNWNKELNQSQQNQDVFSSPGSNSNQQVTERSNTFDEQPSFRSPLNEPQSARRRNLSSAIDVGSPTDVTQLLSSPHQTPVVATDTFMKPQGHLPHEEEEAVDDNPSTGTQPFSIEDHLGGMSSSSQFQPPPASQSQPATPRTPILSDLSVRTANPQPQQPPQQEAELLHKQAPKHQTLHHLPPQPPTGTLPASANQTSSTFDARFLQQFSNQQHQPQQQQQPHQPQQQQPHQPQQQQKEAEKSYSYPNPYQSYLPSLPTPQQPQQQPASSYKYPPHYPWPSHYPYFSPGSGASQSANPLQKNQQDRQSAAVAAAAGLGSSHLGQRSDTMPGAPGHQLSHGHSGLAAGASPLMHAHATQHVSPAHLQQYMMGGPAMMSHEHYLAQAQAAYGYDQNSQQQALQFWQQQQQQHQKQQYPTGLPHGIHASPTQQLGAPTHPLGHTSLWPTHHHLQQPSQFGKSTLFGGAQVGAAKPQDSLFRLSSNQNNNNSTQGTVPMGHVYMGYTHFPRPELFGKQDGEPDSWQPPVLKSTRYQLEGPTNSRMVVEDRNSRQFREEQCKKKSYNVAAAAAPYDLVTLSSASSSSNDSNSLSTSAILEQTRKNSELIHANMVITSTVADS